MPLYFFHRADVMTNRDLEGTELASVDEARKEATVYAGETMQFSPEIAWGGSEFRVEVEDEKGLVLFVLKVSSVDSTHATIAAPC